MCFSCVLRTVSSEPLMLPVNNTVIPVLLSPVRWAMKQANLESVEELSMYHAEQDLSVTVIEV